MTCIISLSIAIITLKYIQFATLEKAYFKKMQKDHEKVFTNSELGDILISSTAKVL